jgi:hypothetical protein
MDNYGLVLKYKVNRSLNEQEKKLHALQNEESGSPPKHEKRLIQMNATYLECVDKFFPDRGIVTALFTVGAGAMIGITYLGFWIIVSDPKYWFPSLALSLTGIILGFFCIKFIILKECFMYTHYPIRFNRKTRKVHVFRTNGTVMNADWEKLYFTLCQRQGLDAENWEVRGHRMAEDGVTVLETFALPYSESSDHPEVLSFWEFVRRYMEAPDDLPALAGQVDSVIDIANKREDFWAGWGRLSEDSPILSTILFPVTLFYSIGRVIANYTSKIPQWPAEVEAECRVEEGDPYLRDAKHIASLVDYRKMDV